MMSEMGGGGGGGWGEKGGGGWGEKGGGKPPCKFFAQGSCTKGDQCNFAHGGSSLGDRGPWFCDCGFRNSPNNELCGGNGPMGCKAPQPQGGKGKGKDKGKNKGKGPDWICEACSFKNVDRNEVCGGSGPMGCKAAKTVPSEAAASAPSGEGSALETLVN